MSQFDRVAMINVTYGHREFSFETSPNVFSPNQLDAGSRLLLEKVQDEKPQTVLDVGCGYGAMGIIFGKSHPNCQVTMIDNDRVALKLAKENVVLNEVNNLKIYKIDITRQTLNRKFDLAISNPPWTKNHSVIPKLITFAFDHLNPGGKLYLVINQAFKTEVVLKEIFQNSEVVFSDGPYKVLRSIKGLSRQEDPSPVQEEQKNPARRN